MPSISSSRTRAPLALAAIALFVPTLAPAQARPHPDMPPVTIGNPGQWFGRDAYPPEAIRAERAGRVVALLSVDATGAVSGCAVQESSGTAVLDTTTCAIATAHMRFNPATDHAGHPVAGTYTLPVRWVLPEHLLTPPPVPVDITAGPPKDMITQIEVDYDAGGTIVACRSMVRNAPESTPDPCLGFQTGTPSPLRWLRNGQPVGATIEQHITQHVTVAP